MLKLGPFRGGIIRTIHEPQICLTTKHSGFVADFAPFFIQVQNMLCNVNEGLLVVISLPQVLAFQKKCSANTLAHHLHTQAPTAMNILGHSISSAFVLGLALWLNFGLASNVYGNQLSQRSNSSFYGGVALWQTIVETTDVCPSNTQTCSQGMGTCCPQGTYCEDNGYYCCPIGTHT